MRPTPHRTESVSWCVVKPNSPVAGRAPTPAPLRFLATPVRPTAPGAPAPLGEHLGTCFQAMGALLVEVPLASDLTCPLPTFAFAPQQLKA